MEAPPGIEPGMEVLQTSALPLGDGAVRRAESKLKALGLCTGTRAIARTNNRPGKPPGRAKPARKLERETGFEPATSTLARSHSTTELFPLSPECRTPNVLQRSQPMQESAGLAGAPFLRALTALPLH